MTAHWGFLLAFALPQGVELSGRIEDLAGAPVDQARIHLAPVPEADRRSRTSYGLALQQHWRTTLQPQATSQADGVWVMRLTPDQAALIWASSAVEIVVRARGHRPWRRTWSSAQLPPDPIVLEPAPATPSLRLHLKSKSAAYRGFVLIERPFRWRSDRETWRGELVPLAPDGTAEFHEPPRISGEVPAQNPSVRPEAYRITLLAEGHPRLRATIPPGDVTMDLSSSRLQPLTDPEPLQATYEHEGGEVTLQLPGPAIPLLHGKRPLRVSLPPGDPVLSTSDLYLYLVSKGEPLPHVGVWVEDRAGGAWDTRPFGVSDENGMLILRIPYGRYKLLFCQPRKGSREIPVTHEPSEPALQVRLTLRPPDAPSTPGKPATMLLDLSKLPPPSESPTSLEVGLLDGELLLRKTFSEWHRLLRVDGLDQGAVTLYVRVGQAPPIFLGGVMAGDVRDRPLDLGAAEHRRIRLHVRDRGGAPELRATMSLREAGAKPSSRSLFHLRPTSQPGHYDVDLRMLGNLWVRVHGQNGGSLDAILPGQERGEVLDTTLR